MKIFLMILSIIAVTACSKSEAVYSIVYYSQHIDEAAAQLKICQNSGTSQIQQTNCQNATQALMLKSVQDNANKPFKGSGL